MPPRQKKEPKPCAADQVRSPTTGRCINKDGKAYASLVYYGLAEPAVPAPAPAPRSRSPARSRSPRRGLPTAAANAAFTAADCAKWAAHKDRNPVTGRKIVEGGPVFRKLQRACASYHQARAARAAAPQPQLPPPPMPTAAQLTAAARHQEVVRRAMQEHAERMARLPPEEAARLQEEARQRVMARVGARVAARKAAEAAAAAAKPKSKSKPASKSKSKSKPKPKPAAKSASPGSGTLAWVQKRCRNDADPITLDEFADMPAEDLRRVVRLASGHCADARALYEYLQTTDVPKNPFTNERFSAQDRAAVEARLRQAVPGFAPRPRKQPLRPPAKFRLSLDDHVRHGGRDFVHVRLVERQGGRTMRDLGYVPADVDVRETGSVDLTSSVLLVNIMTLYEEGKLLMGTVRADHIEWECCRIHLRKPLAYWFDGSRFNVGRFKSMCSEVTDFL